MQLVVSSPGPLLLTGGTRDQTYEYSSACLHSETVMQAFDNDVLSLYCHFEVDVLNLTLLTVSQQPWFHF